jgi:hypothetical protein
MGSLDATVRRRVAKVQALIDTIAAQANQRTGTQLPPLRPQDV